MHHLIDKLYIHHRDGEQCRYCKKALTQGKTTLDHYLPRAMGGTYDLFNLVCSCKKCNNQKRSSVPEDVDAVHLALFICAFTDKKIHCTLSIPHQQLEEWILAVDRVVHEKNQTLFESHTHRFVVKENRIVKIHYVDRLQME